MVPVPQTLKLQCRKITATSCQKIIICSNFAPVLVCKKSLKDLHVAGNSPYVQRDDWYFCRFQTLEASTFPVLGATDPLSACPFWAALLGGAKAFENSCRGNHLPLHQSDKNRGHMKSTRREVMCGGCYFAHPHPVLLLQPGFWSCRKSHRWLDGNLIAGYAQTERVEGREKGKKYWT